MYALTMLLTKRHAIFLSVNAILIFVNFHIWGYDPGVTSRAVTDGDLSRSGADYDAHIPGGAIRINADETIEDNLAPETIEHLARSGANGIRKKVANIGLANLWRSLSHNYSLVRPQVDMYMKPGSTVKISNEYSSRLRTAYQVPDIEPKNLVNCAKILANDPAEHAKAQQIMLTKPKVPIYEETYEEWLRDCVNFRRMRGYVEVPLSEEEEEWPIAYSIAMFKDVESTERLLRAIYRPNNFYCIHIDIKSPLLIHRTMMALTSCFDNVWIASHLDKIKWGDVSVLLPEINCMRDMVKYHRKRKWKYFINLTGQEFPLRTNYEIARIASIFNGSNDIAGSTSRMETDRIKYHWTHRWSKTYQQTIFYNTFLPKEPPPYNLTFFKGELHGLFSRKMVEYIVESPIARNYLKWCWDTGHPSEHYWNVLNYNKHVMAPGGYIGPLKDADEYSDHPIIRAKNWLGLYNNRTCNGKTIRGICVYGTRDTPWLARRPELFANKFHLTYQYIGYDCLEERHRNRTKLKDRIPFDEAFYRSIPTVKYSRKNGL